MGGFSRSAPCNAVMPCPSRCRDGKAADDALVAGTRQRARALLANPSNPPTPCQQRAAQMGGVTARFDRYSDALPAARAARDLGTRKGNPEPASTQPCLTRLPDNAAGLNRALGIDPKSQNAIVPADLHDPRSGYRAALYRDETTGRIIMVPRDTDPHSLADWKTNIDNGRGQDTMQYRHARRLSGKLDGHGVPFDIGGYSKGGGLAQEAGLVSPNSRVFVFNSAGLNSASLRRTGNTSFTDLARRTSSFSAEGDFLTDMNNNANVANDLANARYLREQLAGPSGWWRPDALKPMEILYPDSANPGGGNTAAYQRERGNFFRLLDRLITDRERNPNGPPLFPPVRSGTHDTIPGSAGRVSRAFGSNDPGPSLGKLKQHLMENVVGPDARNEGAMERQMGADRLAMRNFRRSCG